MSEERDQDWEELAPPPEGSLLGEYKVELPVFEGPLDLLLHLIRKHEVDIFDIPIALVLDKYLSYLGWLRALNIEVASEFVVMASTLAHIKSRLLLPPEEAVGEDAEDEQEEEDPREELVRRLLEHQRYKEAADNLREQPILFRDVFLSGGRTRAEEPSSSFASVSVFRLIEALDRLLKKADTTLTHRVVLERLSVADRIHEILRLLEGKPERIFEELFETALTRRLIVATFLAILEMTRLKMIRIHQPEGSDTIYIRSLLLGVEAEAVLARVQLQE